MDSLEVYKFLASPTSDDIEELYLLVRGTIPIFWVTPINVIVNPTIRYQVPWKSRLLGSILTALEQRVTYTGKSLDGWCNVLCNLNGPSVSYREALDVLQKHYIPSIKIVEPMSKKVNLDAYFATYLFLVLHENVDRLREWVQMDPD